MHKFFTNLEGHSVYYRRRNYCLKAIRYRGPTNIGSQCTELVKIQSKHQPTTLALLVRYIAPHGARGYAAG